jgi:uncharacterized heparinase superfamily protein
MRLNQETTEAGPAAPRILSFAVALCLTLKGAAIATEDSARRVFSRADLPDLQRMDREQVFAALRSFDDRGLTEDEFAWRAVELLDAARIPGLQDAAAAHNLDGALDSIARACRPPQDDTRRAATDSRAPAEADDVLAQQFSFYGEKYQLPASIEWDSNPGTGHWGHDLNRFSYLRPLTRAFLATGDTRYSRKAMELILDWIAKCDTSRCFRGSPYVWGSYLNNAIHCQAWCRCTATLLAREQITPQELLRVLKSVHDQLAYLEIVTNGHAGNWPTIGCQGMLECLATFPVFRDTDRFVDYCLANLKTQIAQQVLPDGVQDELTPHYHRVVVSNLLTAIRSLRQLRRELDPDTTAVLRKMVHYVQQTAVPDGSKQVAFNDSDPGSPGTIASSLDELGLAEFLSPPERLGPEVFPYAGVALLRQPQAQGDLYLAFDAGPYGRSHQHEDKLGFWLFAYGRNLLVDPGRHLYDGSARSYYPYLKSTTAHSTIRIDGQDQHSAGRRDTWIARQPLDLHWQIRDGELRASGCYDLGYGKRNEIAVVHHREVVFVKQRCWVVFDLIAGRQGREPSTSSRSGARTRSLWSLASVQDEGLPAVRATEDGEHLIESRFQFAPGSLVVEGVTVHTDYDDANLLLQTAATASFHDIRTECGQADPRGGWYSDSYGKIEPAPALVLAVRTALPWRAATLLYPYQGRRLPQVSLRYGDGAAELVGEDRETVRVECTLPAR